MDAGGEHDDRQFARPLVGAQFLGQRDAGLSGQHPVEDHQVRQRGADGRFALFGAAGTNNQEAGMLEINGDKFLDCRFVFNDQNRRSHCAFSLM